MSLNSFATCSTKSWASNVDIINASPPTIVYIKICAIWQNNFERPMCNPMIGETKWGGKEDIAI